MPPLNQKQIDFLLNLQKNLEGGAVQPAELAEVIKVLVTVFKNYRTELNNKVDITGQSLKVDLDKAILALENKGKIGVAELNKVIKDQLQEIIKDTGKRLNEVKGELKALRDTIPPEVDLSEIWSKLDNIIIPSSDEIQQKIEKNLPQYGEVFRDGLELLEGGERLKIEAIKDLREELDELKKRPIAFQGGGIVGRDIIQDIDISDDLDGVTKTFNIQAVWRIISVDLSSFPYGSLRKNIDYTWTPTSITFTDEIDAATQLAEGQSCILTVVTG